MRPAIFILLALVALVIDAFTAYWLIEGLAENPSAQAATIRAFPFFPDWVPTLPEVLLLHAMAAAIGAFFLSFASTTPSSGDSTARWILLLCIAIPLPGIGLAVAVLITAAIALSKKQPAAPSPFVIGNPLDPTNTDQRPDLEKTKSGGIPLPLTTRVRGADVTDLRSLAIGLRGLPFARTATVLERLQRDPDTYLQLYAQGDFAEAAEMEESRLRALNAHVTERPDDQRARLALADHLNHLAAAPQIANDQRTLYLERALVLLEDLQSPRAHALRTTILIQIGEVDSASQALDALAASDPDSQSVTKKESATLQAQLLHRARRWSALTDFLTAPEFATYPEFAATRAFFAHSASNSATAQ